MASNVNPYPDAPLIPAGAVKRSDSAYAALMGSKDPAYQFAVVRAYIQDKCGRGKAPPYISAKLRKLESKVPHSYGPAFVYARACFDLPRSTVFRDVQPQPTTQTAVGEQAPPPYAASGAVPAITLSLASTSLSPTAATASGSSPAVPSSSTRTPSKIDIPTSGAGTGGALGTPGTANTSRAASPSPLEQNGELPLEMLADFDTVFLVDDSGSMTHGTRWQQAQTAIRGVVAHAMKYDKDGIDVYFLNSRRKGEGLKKPKDVDKLFSGLTPNGATPTGKCLETILRGYMQKLEKDASTPPLNLIVITDGAPTDDPESVLVAYARRLDKGDYPLSQVGIQMFQVGNDPAATAALAELDDGLAGEHGIRDMVDTVPYQGDMTPEFVIKVLLGGINRRLDRKAVK